MLKKVTVKGVSHIGWSNENTKIFVSSCLVTMATINKPVSYTHLDVYKRQDMHLSAPNLLTYHPKIQTPGLIPCQILNQYVPPCHAYWVVFTNTGRIHILVNTYQQNL